VSRYAAIDAVPVRGLDPGLFGAGCGIRRIGLRRVRPCCSVLRARTARL